MKPKRGQKLCKKCNGINGARAHSCKHCNEPYVAKSTPKNIKVKKKKHKMYEAIEDWKSLDSGTKIKVLARSGNYYIGESGDRQYMSDAGIYTIQAHDQNGLIVYGNDGGYGYIYMGPEIKSESLPNMYRSPHKIVKVNMPVRPI